MAVSASTVADDPRWPRIVARDTTADGLFWYSVATTGVFCRPSCPSRRANPANVAIHATLEEARRTGFRPCHRCTPDGPSAEARTADLVLRVCRLLDAAERPPSLSELGAALAMSPGHLQRRFRAATGLTPRGYVMARRAARLRDGLSDADTATAAFHAAGFGSSGRFYEQSSGILGMTPGRFRAGGAGEQLRYAVAPCSLGEVLVASSDTGVVAILLGEGADALARDLARRFPNARLASADTGYRSIVDAVVAMVEMPGTGLALPLDLRGTLFQQRVWAALRAIPPGETLSYAELAARVGVAGGARAVAGACAANAHAVAIPCHRIVRGDGGLSGYRWGPERKRMLLERERASRR